MRDWIWIHGSMVIESTSITIIQIYNLHKIWRIFFSWKQEYIATLGILCSAWLGRSRRIKGQCDLFHSIINIIKELICNCGF